MNESSSDSDSSPASDPAENGNEGLRTIAAWLGAPRPAKPRDELDALRGHLVALRELRAPATERTLLLDRLLTRSLPLIGALTPTLTDDELPLRRQSRRLLHGLHDLLWRLAEDLPAACGLGDAAFDGARGTLAALAPRGLWNSVDVLARHLLLSHLTASPPGAGVWLALHQRYAQAVRLGLTDWSPGENICSTRHLYSATLAIACAHPTALSAREVAFAAALAARFGERISAPAPTIPGGSAIFWLDPLRDQPPAPLVRRSPPPDSGALFFSCAALAALIDGQLAGTAAELLPPAEGFDARRILRHLSSAWGAPRKRRFQRRRHSRRARVYAGLANVLDILRGSLPVDATPPAQWMVVNESPDGYAIMHVAGDSGRVAVGEVALIRSEDDEHWQLCLIRWALSESPEHLEVGLQIMAPEALPALLVRPNSRESQPALLLPELQPLYEFPRLLVAAATLPDFDEPLIVVAESNRLEVREVRMTRIEEMTASIALFSVQPDEAL